MPFVYQSGEKIAKGDRVVYDGIPAEIEFVVDPSNSPEDWYVKQFGGGLMIAESKVFGRLFLSESEVDDRLVFVSRLPESETNST
jgi:hypothetical protein